MNFYKFLLLTLFPLNSFAGEKMFCIKMEEVREKIVSRACLSGHQLRLDAMVEKTYEPVAIVDLQKITNIRIDNAKKEYIKEDVANVLAEAEKRGSTIKDEDRQGKTAKEYAQKSKVAPVENKNNSDCEWYSITGVQETSKTCIKKFPNSTVQSIVELVSQVRAYERKSFPLRLMGLPLLNVDLPIYKSDGVIKAGYLPALAETGNLSFSINYSFEPLPANFFDPPKEFAEVRR